MQMVECPVCMHSMDSPIYQCHNGHTICRVCHQKVEQCPTCRADLDKKRPSRALALEQIIDSHGLKVPCLNHSRGCTELLKWGNEQARHAAVCQHRLVPCPDATFKLTNCTAMLKLSEVKAHCVKEHKCSDLDQRGAKTWWGGFVPTSKTLYFVPKVMAFVAIDDSGIVVYFRHLEGEPLKYKVTARAYGSKTVYAGVTEPIDQKIDFEVEKRKALFLHRQLTIPENPVPERPHGVEINYLLKFLD